MRPVLSQRMVGGATPDPSREKMRKLKAYAFNAIPMEDIFLHTGGIIFDLFFLLRVSSAF